MIVKLDSKLKYLMVLLLVLFACDKSNEQKPLVTISGEMIFSEDLMSIVPTDLWDILSEDEKKELLDDLINNRLLAQEASKRGLADNPEIAARIKATRMDILSNIMEENLLQSGIEVNQQEIADFYNKNLVLFARNNDEVRLYKLSFPDEETADSAFGLIKARGDSLNLNDFKEVAIQFPMDSSNLDLDYIPIDGLFNSLKKKVRVAQEGELIGPLNSGQDYSIFLVNDLGREGTTRPLEYVQREIENLIYIEKSEKLRQAFTDSLRQFYRPELNRAVWDSLMHR